MNLTLFQAFHQYSQARESLLKVIAQQPQVEPKSFDSFEEEEKAEELCPLTELAKSIGSSHYSITEQLFGTGCWKWNCPLCGVEHQE